LNFEHIPKLQYADKCPSFPPLSVPLLSGTSTRLISYGRYSPVACISTSFWFSPWKKNSGQVECQECQARPLSAPLREKALKGKLNSVRRVRIWCLSSFLGSLHADGWFLLLLFLCMETTVLKESVLRIVARTSKKYGNLDKRRRNYAL
jgi:hypothetical protein